MRGPSVLLVVTMVALVAPVTGCVDRPTLDVLHVDDIVTTFEEPNRLNITFNLYQFQGSRTASLRMVQVGASLHGAPGNGTVDPLRDVRTLEGQKFFEVGDSHTFSHAFELKEGAEDADTYALYSVAILVRYDLRGGARGGEVLYSGPCFTRDNAPFDTNVTYCEPVYRYEKNEDAPLPGSSVWQARLDACCRSGGVESGSGNATG